VARLRSAGARGVVVDDAEGRFHFDGRTIEGEHPWVPADTAALAVICQEDRAYVLAEGLELAPVAACGLEAAGAARLFVRKAPVVAVIDDVALLARARSRVRLHASALLVGTARGAHAYAMRYAIERTAFGRPIAHHQALAFLLVEMAMGIEAARLATWRAASVIDRGQDARWETAIAFAEAAEHALFVGPNAVQALGGHGFMKDHPVEKWMRDIRTLAQLGGGRDEAEITASALAPDHDAGLR
jgi:alkylation response protein AidB-like acyl-CoA dehydrogenase